jgi:hypothetical protein
MVECSFSCLNITGIGMLQDFVPPAPQPPIWPEGGMVYADMSQPPPVQIPSASGMTVKITFGKHEISVSG